MLLSRYVDFLTDYCHLLAYFFIYAYINFAISLVKRVLFKRKDKKYF